MFAKLNSYKFQANPIDHKETKLQKYLRERNEELLAKCFNIKIEKTVVKNNETSQKLQEANNEKLSGQPNNREAYQQTCENISLITISPQEVASLQTPIKAVTESEPISGKEKTGESSSAVRNSRQSSKSTQLSESPNKHRSTSAQLASNYNPSLNSKPSRTTQQQTKRSVSSPNNWKSPFNSFTTKGIRARAQHSQQSAEFSYDLSRDELKFAGPFCSPMRPTPEAERQLLKSGQRREYLMQRYEHSPVVKYNYPEATSWRIGWLQQKQ